jgi:hypothetical protein
MAELLGDALEGLGNEGEAAGASHDVGYDGSGESGGEDSHSEPDLPQDSHSDGEASSSSGESNPAEQGYSRLGSDSESGPSDGYNPLGSDSDGHLLGGDSDAPSTGTQPKFDPNSPQTKDHEAYKSLQSQSIDAGIQARYGTGMRQTLKA